MASYKARQMFLRKRLRRFDLEDLKAEYKAIEAREKRRLKYR